jgi:hypothetical protein
MEGRLAQKGRAMTGHWFCMDSEVYDKDRCNIVITLAEDKQSIDVRCSMKDGSVSEWSARRPVVRRDGGKLSSRGASSGATARSESGAGAGGSDVFSRLTQPTSPRRKDWLETQRTELLASTLRDAKVANAGREVRGGDGALTYIPPLTLGEPFDESGPSKFYLESARFRGRQMYASLNVVGRPMTSPAAPSFPHVSRPYMGPTEIARGMRLEREKREASLPATLRGRKSFRPTSSAATAVGGGDGALFLSAVDAGRTTDAEMERMRRTARESGGFAEIPRRCVAAAGGLAGACEDRIRWLGSLQSCAACGPGAAALFSQAPYLSLPLALVTPCRLLLLPCLCTRSSPAALLPPSAAALPPPQTPAWSRARMAACDWTSGGAHSSRGAAGTC